MLTKENVLFSVADHPTPKIDDSGIGYTLNSRDYKDAQCVVTRVFDSHRAHEFKEYTEVCESVLAHYGTGGGNTPMVLENREPVLLESTHSHATTNENGIATTLVKSMEQGKGYVPMVTQGINGDTAGTLDSNYFKGCGEREGTEREVVCVGNGQLNQMPMSEQANALDCMHDQQAVMENLVVRRLTPKECSRLQGYPDGWMDIGEWTDSKGKLHKDSDAPKYKAAGNSIALPFWQWLMDRIVKQLKKDGCDNPTMASLFDGISGFPLCAIRSGIKPVWSSEIEEFPMAVAERHFGENGDIEKFL